MKILVVFTAAFVCRIREPGEIGTCGILRGIAVMFENVFLGKKVNRGNLAAYGFVMQDGKEIYETNIVDGMFRLTVRVAENGEADTDLIEVETGEPYWLYKTTAAGAFVGKIRAAVEAVLTDISNICYGPAAFRTNQAQMAREFVRETYGDELEFLWPKSPGNAVWRRKDNRKWYGAMLTVQGRKICLDTDETAEIIDLRMNPADRDNILSREHYYPGWHMNKKSWYTLVLGEYLPDEEIKSRIAESYELAGSK